MKKPSQLPATGLDVIPSAARDLSCGSKGPLASLGVTVVTHHSMIVGTSRRSVPLRDVNFLQKLSSGVEATDVCGDLGYELGHGRPPRHVRHYRNLGMKPKRAFWWQRLRPKCVQGGV